MTWFLYLVSIVLVVVGAVSILYTDWVRKSLREMVAKKYFRLLGLVPLILGILLIISAGWSEVFWLVFLLGVVALAKGFFLLFSSKARIDTAITWTLDTASDQVYRFSGVISLVLGMALISWIR
jgi:uncharacterized protein YjeT (DUF2065 family)